MPTEISTQDSSKTTLNMESVSLPIQIKVLIMENGVMEKRKGKASTHTPTKMYTQEGGSMERSTAKGPMCSTQLE